MKRECDLVINAWTTTHSGSESSYETLGKPHLTRVVKTLIFSDIFEAELFSWTSRLSTFSIVINDGVNEGLMVGLY